MSGLTEEERRAIDAEMAHYPDPRAATVEALKVVQARRGWVPDAALAAVAERLGMSAAELEGVATFYNLIFRRPVGRHVVLMCDSVSCWLLGYEALQRRLRERFGIGFGETDAEGRFTLLPIPCLGTCDRAPAVLVDGDLHTDLTPDRLEALLSDYR